MGDEKYVLVSIYNDVYHNNEKQKGIINFPKLERNWVNCEYPNDIIQLRV